MTVAVLNHILRKGVQKLYDIEIFFSNTNLVRHLDSILTGYDINNIGYDINNIGYDINNIGYDINNIGYDINNIGYDFNNIGYDINNIGYDINNIGYDNFHDICMYLLNKYVPIKCKYLRANDGPFMNKDPRKAVMFRSRLKNNYNKDRSDLSKLAYNKQRNKCTNLFRKAKRDYYSN